MIAISWILAGIAISIASKAAVEIALILVAGIEIAWI